MMNTEKSKCREDYEVWLSTAPVINVWNAWEIGWNAAIAMIRSQEKRAYAAVPKKSAFDTLPDDYELG